MMNLADAIKRCSMEAYEASVPCDVVLGEVIESSPCRVKIGKMVLPDEVLIISKQLERKEENITLGHYSDTIVINEGINVGDILILLRQSGGVSYVAVGKI